VGKCTRCDAAAEKAPAVPLANGLVYPSVILSLFADASRKKASGGALIDEARKNQCHNTLRHVGSNRLGVVVLGGSMNEMVVAYLFLGGAGAGLLVVLSVLELLREHGKPFATSKFRYIAWPLCLLVVLVAITMLAADLGRFDRLLQILASPAFTAITVGAIALAACAAGSAVASVVVMSDRLEASRVFIHGFCVFNIVAGAVAMSYTGILLSSMPSVVAWQTPLIPVLFVCSSLTCGLACALGVNPFVDERDDAMPLVESLVRAGRISATCEVVALVAWLFWCVRSGAEYAWLALASGAYAPWFWMMLVTVGLLLPPIMSRFAKSSSRTTLCLVLAACVLTGGVALRFCVVGIAAFDPSQAVHALVAPFM
jgi:formate-dependent nitrite reductase membrane component NrfD